MNKYEKEIIQLQLDHEKDILKELKDMYEEAEKQIDEKIQMLMTDELTQSKIYQLEYQKALKSQIEAILDNMNSNNYDTIKDYLKQCYEDGYLSAMYSLHKQGIPLILPINQEMIVKAIMLDSKLSVPLYESLGINTNDLKKVIRREVSRGISNGYSYRDIARNIKSHMNIGLNKSIRIARTEGHRVNQESTMDGMYAAKENGADIVKQWDATMDKNTRPSHQRVDGEIRELDEKFSNGLRFPGDPQGVAGEVINCRCVLLQRARWALDNDELETLKKRAEYYGLDKTDSFDDFKAKYLNVASNATSYSSNGAIIDTAPDVTYIENTYGTTHSTVAKATLENADPDIQNVWNKYQSKFKTDNPKYSGKKASYSSSSDSVILNIDYAAKGSDYQTPYQVLYHEYGHMTDYLIARDYGADKFTAFSEIFGGLDSDGNAIITSQGSGILGITAKNELKDLLSSIKKANGFKKNAYAVRFLIDEITNNYSLIARGDVSDMLEGAGLGVKRPLGVGHGTSYWKNRDNGKEIFAEIFSAEIANSESLNCIKTYFPETYKIFKEMLGVIK